VAGPIGLATDVKAALRFDVVGPRAILTGGSNVTLHVETYSIVVRACIKYRDRWMTYSLWCPTVIEHYHMVVEHGLVMLCKQLQMSMSMY
jgi:hypothetical protein